MNLLFDLPEETQPSPKKEKRFYMFVSDNGVKYYAYRPRSKDQHRHTYSFYPDNDPEIGNRKKVEFKERGIAVALAYWSKQLKKSDNRFMGSEEVR